jgi:hypothetical protein
LAIAFVAGKNRVPKPAAGITAFRTFVMGLPLSLYSLFHYNKDAAKKKRTSGEVPFGTRLFRIT